MSILIEVHSNIRGYWRNFVKWRTSTSITYKIGLAFTMAAVTGIFAQIRVYLPWTPVPITLQTFAVLISPLILGGIWGTVSQILYITLGIAGIHWFAGWKGGVEYISAATTGYLIGFAFAAAFVGYIIKHSKVTESLILMSMMLFIANTIIYIFGISFLWIWCKTFIGRTSINKLLRMGLFPFILGDILKILILTTTYKILLNNQLNTKEN